MNRPNSSMQLTRAADYGVRVLIHLASSAGSGRQSLPQLAHSTDAPESFLSKVLQALVHAGLIESRRGQSGGFVISQLGNTATIRTVIEAVDGPVRLNLCLAEGRSCHRKSWCPAHPVWERAQQAMFSVLDATTVAELAGKPPACPQEICAASSLCTPQLQEF
jgi:Rrf2 family iron-sulfur cluster assembly transcriptional regulator